MRLTDFAAAYCHDKKIKKVPLCSARRFAALAGDIHPKKITQEMIDRYVIMAREQGTPAWTIRGTVKDVRTLAIAAGGRTVRNTVKAPQPNPQPCDLTDIDAAWPYLAQWSKQWLVLAYWTCLRLDDSICLQLSLNAESSLLAWTASKTKWTHRYPIAEWLRPHLDAVVLPYGRNMSWAGAIVRAELERCSTLAGVPRLLASTIRDRALTEWSKTGGDVGAIMHGHGLGTRRFYVPPHELIAAAMHRLRTPSCFGATVSESEALLSSFTRLDPAGQRLICETAERLAAS